MGPRTALVVLMLRRAAASLLPYVVLVVTKHLDFLYLAQLERYKSPRLWGWISRRWRMVLDAQAALLQAAVLVAGIILAWFRLPVIIFYMVWMAAGMWLSARRSSLQVSQRLQFTPRAVRLTAVTFILAMAIVAGTTVLTVALLSPLLAATRAFLVAIGLATGLVVVSEVTAGTVFLANLSLAPLEQAINRRYCA